MKTEPGQSESANASNHAPRWKLIAAFAAIYIIWGSTYLGIRYAVESIPPFLMAGSRFFAAGLFLFMLERFRSEAKATLPQWRNALISGSLLLLVGNGGVTWAEKIIPSAVASLLVALVPLWMVLIDWARPAGVRPKPLVFAGLIAGFAGVAFLAAGKTGNGTSAYAWGVVVLLLSSIGWAIGSIFSRHADKPGSPPLGVALQMIAGGGSLLLLGILLGEGRQFSTVQVTRTSLIAWLYLTTFGSLIGFTAYTWLLRVSTPARVSTYAYVNPFIAVLLGCTIGHEAFSTELMTAGVLIILAVALIVRSGAEKPIRN